MAHGQIKLDWVNTQYIPSNDNAYDSYTLNGNVRKIEETLTNKNSNEGAKITTTISEFLSGGKLSYIKQTFPDGSVSKTWFEYDATSESYCQWWIYLFNTGQSLDTIRFNSLGMTTITPHADSLVLHQNGLTCYFKLNEDEVISFYDATGRKVRDSVATYGEYNHEINYRYRKH